MEMCSVSVQSRAEQSSGGETDAQAAAWIKEALMRIGTCRRQGVGRVESQGTHRYLSLLVSIVHRTVR